MHVGSFKLFCDLAETASFTQAARLNGITQSAVSQHLSSLERQLDCLLVERSRKGFRLTPEGEVLHRHGREIVASHEALLSGLQEVRRTVAGTIQIAAVYSLGLHLLPPYLTRFLKAFPSVHVHVDYQRADRVYEAVRDNAADLGLVAYPVADRGLEIIPLGEEPLVVICPPGHPLAAEKAIRLEQLHGQKLIGFRPDIPTRKAIDDVFQKHGIAVRHVMEVDNVETVKRAVEAEAGLALVPAGSAAPEVAQRSLVALPLAGGGLNRPVALIHARRKNLSPAMRRFIQVLQTPPDPGALAGPGGTEADFNAAGRG